MLYFYSNLVGTPERNNRQRSRGARVVDGRGHSGGRWRRERMDPQQEKREAIPAGRSGVRAEVLGRFRAELEDRLRWERVSLGKAHSEAVRGGEVYRSGVEGSEERAHEATRRDPLAVYNRYRGGDWDRLKRSASEERMEQVREFDGEQAYEKMMRAMEEARQEKARQAERARQVERARLEWARQETARQSRERRGPERSGPERDFGPSR